MEHRQPAAHASIICGVPLDLASNLHRFLNGKAPRSHGWSLACPSEKNGGTRPGRLSTPALSDLCRPVRRVGGPRRRTTGGFPFLAPPALYLFLPEESKQMQGRVKFFLCLFPVMCCGFSDRPAGPEERSPEPAVRPAAQPMCRFDN